MFLPNKCACRDSFSSLTENCQTTDAAISVWLWQLKIYKNQLKDKLSIFKSTTCAWHMYGVFLRVEITYHLFLKSAVHFNVNYP